MEAGSSSEMVTSDEASKNGNNKLIPSSVTSVFSNYDLLVEILLRLPVLSLLLFKSVSKHWLSLITDSNFISRHLSQNPYPEPPFGILFLRRNTLLYRPECPEYNFKSFDNRIPSKTSNVLTLPPVRLEILQSCNGLLLCCSRLYKYYVYNPAFKLFKMIPTNSPVSSSTRMAFDPTKSRYYKVIQSAVRGSSIQLHTYSSETSSWSVCGDRFPAISFNGFNLGVYFDDAIHWLNISSLFSNNILHFKLDIANEQPVLTELELPLTFDGKSYFQSKLFVSRGCLLLIGKDRVRYQQLNVYEMRNGRYSKWSVKYIVNLDDIMMPFPRRWRIRSCVWSIVLGEREGDSFIIIDLLNKVVQYNPMLKTVHTLADVESLGSPFISNFDGFQFIASFAPNSAFCFWFSI